MKKEEVCSRRGINLAVMIYDITKNPTHNFSKNDSAVAEETEGEREREREGTLPKFLSLLFLLQNLPNCRLPSRVTPIPFFPHPPFSRASVRPEWSAIPCIAHLTIITA